MKTSEELHTELCLLSTKLGKIKRLLSTDRSLGWPIKKYEDMCSQARKLNCQFLTKSAEYQAALIGEESCG